MSHTAADILANAGVTPTPNRILVTKALIESTSPMSLVELEKTLETLDRSSISRSLAHLLSHGAIHAMEDGRGITKYEICQGEHDCSMADMHAHFYCEQCKRVYCFEHINAPDIALPEGFRPQAVNYMIKGICPDCDSSVGDDAKLG